jgi:hypothetical protein
LLLLYFDEPICFLLWFLHGSKLTIRKVVGGGETVPKAAEEIRSRRVPDGRRHGLEIRPSSMLNEKVADWDLIAGVHSGRGGGRRIDGVRRRKHLSDVYEVKEEGDLSKSISKSKLDVCIGGFVGVIADMELWRQRGDLTAAVAVVESAMFYGDVVRNTWFGRTEWNKKC